MSSTGDLEPSPTPVTAVTPSVSGVVLGPFATNCYTVHFPGSDEAWFIDAGEDPAELLDLARRQRLRPVALILTHAHCDHIAGVRDVLSAYPGLPIWMHAAEAEWLNDPLLNLSALIGMPVTAPAAAAFLHDGQSIMLAGQPWTILHTPGHSPGGITLYHEPSHTAISGDALFAGSIGRTDFPGSDHPTLIRSIKDRLYTLPDDTRVFPGHGPPTTIGRERRTNPFVRG